jgi:ABC-2 type transport system ATP-binding protein
MWSIETKKLTKKFGDYTAVDSISFSVSKGEIFGFLGANGAGKTTAIRMLCGLLIPTSGAGYIAGFDVMKDTDKIRRRIGYMSQKFSLYGDLTFGENLKLYGSIYGLEKKQMQLRIDEMIDLLHMKDLLLKRTDTVPWGWQQRLSLACANLHTPEILFLDEPTGSVDPVSRRTFWDFIVTLSEKGTTVFVTTHHLDEAEYCNRISVMISGRIAAIDTPKKIKSQTGSATLHDAFLKLVAPSDKGNK